MKKLLLSDSHEKMGGKMIDFAGFYMPVQYEGVNAEHQTVRDAVGVFDVSHMGEFFVSGQNAESFLQYMTSNDVAKLTNGQVQYTCMPNDKGGIVDDLLLYKLEENHYMLVVNASNIEKDLQWLKQHNSFGCSIDNQSDAYSLLAVQGPKSIALLQQLTAVELSAIPYYHFRIDKLAGIENVIISRTGYTGELGFELYVKNEYINPLWEAIFNTDITLKPIGLAARDTLRLEKGFCLYGNDIDESTSPLEAGLGWITKFSKAFIYSTELLEQKQTGLSKKLVGLELVDKGIARHGYLVFSAAGKEIGVITSGTMSPTLKKAIAMGYVSAEFSQLNNEVFVQIRDKQIRARIVALPFVK